MASWLQHAGGALKKYRRGVEMLDDVRCDDGVEAVRCQFERRVEVREAVDMRGAVQAFRPVDTDDLLYPFPVHPVERDLAAAEIRQLSFRIGRDGTLICTCHAIGDRSR